MTLLAMAPRRCGVRHGAGLEGPAATLVAALRARAHDARRPLSLLADRRALALEPLFSSLVSQLEGAPWLVPVVRTMLFDDIVRAFLARHPAGTVVEVGAGLNTRFERLDNKRQRWLDVDLPEVVALRDALLPRRAHRTHVVASLEDEAWVEQLGDWTGAACFVFEAVLGYVEDRRVRSILAAVARRAPGAVIAFDLHPRWQIVDGELITAKQPSSWWVPDVPRGIEAWGIGLELVSTTRFLGWSPRRSSRTAGLLGTDARGVRSGAPRVIAHYVAHSR